MIHDRDQIDAAHWRELCRMARANPCQRVSICYLDDTHAACAVGETLVTGIDIESAVETAAHKLGLRDDPRGRDSA